MNPATISQEPTQQTNPHPSINIEGEGNNTFAGPVSVDGNIIIYSQQQDDEFTSLKLDDYESPLFPSPENVDEFTQIIKTKHLLILSGNAGVDKSDLARHIALKFSQSAEENLSVLEWIRTPGTRQLLHRVHKTDKSTIFLFPEVSKRDLSNTELSQLREKGRKHYIIISTDLQRQDWNISDSIRDECCYELSTEKKLFNPKELESTLVQRLKDERDVMPLGIVESAGAQQTLDGKLTTLDIATRLKTHERVLLLIDELRGKKTIPDGFLERLVEDIANRATISLSYWYQNLTSRERLLTITANLFTGLFDDQFFTTLEYLVERIWRRHEPQIAQYDYSDLADLNLFFKLTNTQNGGQILEASFPDQRYELFKMAWNSSRRKILSTLPYLAMLVRNSVKQKSSNRELYGTKLKCERLRRSVAEALSDIGRIDSDAIEPILIELAADPAITVQAVAAQAIARWRYFDNKDTKRLYDLLERWQSETRIIDLVSAILAGSQETVEQNPQSYIRSTIALTVGFAGLYDPPNQLAKRLLKLFNELSDDESDLVRNRFRGYTLQMIVPRHLKQIKDSLRQIANLAYEDREAIAISLRETYQTNPEDVIQTLDEWWNECHKQQPDSFSSKTPTSREKLLATIALTYGEIDYDDGGPLTASDIFNNLKKLLSEEKHPFVRQAVIFAIASQAERNFKSVDELLQKSLVDLTDQDLDVIVDEFTRIYIKQRANLEGADEGVTIDRRRYPIWLPPKATPKTEIENSLQRWVIDDNYPEAQQVALCSKVKFAEIVDQTINKYVNQIAESRKKFSLRVIPSSSEIPQASIKASSDWFIRSFVPWLVTLGTSEYRSKIRNLLPEAIKLHRNSTPALSFVFDEWSKSSDSEMNTLASKLQIAIKRAGQRGMFIAGLVVSTIVVLYIIF